MLLINDFLYLAGKKRKTYKGSDSRMTSGAKITGSIGGGMGPTRICEKTEVRQEIYKNKIFNLLIYLYTIIHAFWKYAILSSLNLILLWC